NGMPVYNVPVEIQKGGSTVWKAFSDNLGRAELWIGLHEDGLQPNLSTYTLLVDNSPVNVTLMPAEQGIHRINMGRTVSNSTRVELAFIVDATGSMSDELEFLKDDLMDVINTVSNNNTSLNILTSTVFYRDVDDDYVVRHSGFSSEIDHTLAFINQQSADGGGDFPEAVHTALATALNELQWSSDSRTRIAFMLLDAPPHHEPQIIDKIQSLTKLAAGKGVKLIPITASGIDKETEFLMRFMAIATNGTYVFITDDSGIGNDHLEASVGSYEVEKLNALLVRLIEKYSQWPNTTGNAP
ncbi:MAG: hypothetical protein AAGA86_11485, partial [Bacteroidota bacterium]